MQGMLPDSYYEDQIKELEKGKLHQMYLKAALDMGEGLLRSGAEVSRVEDTVQRLLLSQGASRVDVLAISSGIVVTAYWSFYPETQTRRIRSTAYNMMNLIRINELSRQVCAHRCGLMDAGQQVAELENGQEESLIGRMGIFALVSASFCLFFGGTWLDALCSIPVGVMLCLFQRLLERLDIRGTAATLTLAILGGLMARGLMAAGLPCSPDKISIGNIMLLVPGIAMTNAVRDMITGETITGLLRFCESLLQCFALALGFAFAILLI